jgi:hypothetical protein
MKILKGVVNLEVKNSSTSICLQAIFQMALLALTCGSGRSAPILWNALMDLSLILRPVNVSRPESVQTSGVVLQVLILTLRPVSALQVVAIVLRSKIQSVVMMVRRILHHAKQSVSV